MNTITRTIAVILLISQQQMQSMEQDEPKDRIVNFIKISRTGHQTHCCVPAWSTTHKKATVSCNDGIKHALQYSMTNVMPFNKVTEITDMTLDPADAKDHRALTLALSAIIKDACINNQELITYKVNKPDQATHNFFTKNEFGSWGYEGGKITFYKRFSPEKLKTE